MRRPLAIMLAAAIGGLLTGQGASPDVVHSGVRPSGTSRAAVERAIIACANRNRRARGLEALEASTVLSAAARMHARNMARRGFFDHTDPQDRGPAERVAMFDRDDQFTYIGENIAAGYRSARAACRGWMRSAGHRANILERGYTSIGGGFARGGPYRRYFVQVFARHVEPEPPQPPGTTEPPPAPPPSPHRMTVHFGPGDDRQSVYLNGSLVGEFGYAEAGTFDFTVADGDQVRVVDWNEFGGFVWDVSVAVDGTTTFSDRGGQTGSYGACDNAQQPTQAIVFDVTLDYRGTVLNRRTACE